jgi:hypothetical protein
MMRPESPAGGDRQGEQNAPLPYMLQCVVRIIGDRRNKRTVKLERVALGTAFYMPVPSESVSDRYYGTWSRPTM